MAHASSSLPEAPSPLPFGAGDRWVRRGALAAVTALALGLVALGFALYGPRSPEPAPFPTLTLQETYR